MELAGPVLTSSSATGWNIPVPPPNTPCIVKGHNYAISGPFDGSDVARRYDLICSKCGDAKTVKVQAG